ncbi:hypothetical protein B0H10DRAFT_2077766 [Mycena sp. CBHHK59/15]|nr:hypothetical protein B0H10DRAFT_2077766 [Mycena sp. CBHHK59/15]
MEGRPPLLRGSPKKQTPRTPSSWSWQEFEHCHTSGSRQVQFEQENGAKHYPIFRYNIDPDFFKCCADGVVTHSQDKRLRSGLGDHVRITLPFLHGNHKMDRASEDGMLTFIGIYMIRAAAPADRLYRTSTIICCLPTSDISLCHTLREWFAEANKEAIWKHIFETSKNPTFVVLPVLWYTIYAWSDALWNVYEYIDKLESDVLTRTSTALTRELHDIRNCLVSYRSLLDDFLKTVAFLQSIPVPGSKSSPSFSYFGGASSSVGLSNSVVHGNLIIETIGPRTPGTESDQSKEDTDRFRVECEALILEIRRLQESIEARNIRISAVMNMVFSIVTIRDSTAMKQISYVTMVFIPGTFVAGVFGMNVEGIGPDSTPLRLYPIIVVPLTVIILYIAVAFQKEALGWPYEEFVRAKKQVSKVWGRHGRRVGGLEEGVEMATTVTLGVPGQV